MSSSDRLRPPLSVAGPARVVSIKDITSGVRCSCFMTCGTQPARPWTHLESFAAYTIQGIECLHRLPGSIFSYPPPALPRYFKEIQAGLHRVTVKKTTYTDHPWEDLHSPPFVEIHLQRLQEWCICTHLCFVCRCKLFRGFIHWSSQLHSSDLPKRLGRAPGRLHKTKS